MTVNISDELKKTFSLSALRQLSRSLRTPNDWEKGGEIIKRFRKETNKQTQLYLAEYDTRISRVMKQLIDQAGSKNRTLTYRIFGSDNFSKDELKKQAHKHVQQDHHNRISHLEQNEAKELNTLIETVEQRDQSLDRSKQDFNRATNRHDQKNQPHHPKRTR